MFSTDNNIFNHLAVDEIELLREIDSDKLPHVVYCDENTFKNKIKIKDPNTVYYVDHKHMFYGDTEINIHQNPVNRYLLGHSIDKGSDKYIIYMVYDQNNNEIMTKNRIVEICSFKSPEDALRILDLYNKLGYHDSLHVNIYKMILQYLWGNININDLIIGAIGEFGYKNDPALQTLITTINSYGANYSKKDLPMILREELRSLKKYSLENHKYFLIAKYSDIYDVIIKYNFFRKEKSNDIDQESIFKSINEIIVIFYVPPKMVNHNMM